MDMTSKELAYGPDANQHISIARPDVAGTGRPVVYVVHGGLSGDDISDTNLHAADLITQEGWGAVLVDYRDWGNPSPPSEQLADLNNAITWVTRNRSAFGFASRFAILGFSLGGYLTGLYNTSGYAMPRAVATLSPMVDPPSWPDTAPTHADIQTVIGCAEADCPDQWAAWSLLNRIAFASVSMAPWFHAQSPDEFVPLAQGQALEDQLATSNVTRKFDIMPAGSGHAAAYLDAVWPDVKAWFATYLAR